MPLIQFIFKFNAVCYLSDVVPYMQHKVEMISVLFFLGSFENPEFVDLHTHPFYSFFMLIIFFIYLQNYFTFAFYLVQFCLLCLSAFRQCHARCRLAQFPSHCTDIVSGWSELLPKE